MRTARGKANCKILDFGQNAECHGPIDDIRIAKKRNPTTGLDELIIQTSLHKECSGCGELLPKGVRRCECRHMFAVIEETASREAVMTDFALPPGFFEGEVSGVEYAPPELSRQGIG